MTANDSIAELRSAVEAAARALRDGEPTEPAALPSTARPRPSWATTAPTRRCCSPPRSARTRAPSPSASAAELGARARRRRERRADRGGGPRVRQPLPLRRLVPARDGRPGRRRRAARPGARPPRPNASWSSSSPPTRPGRCTSAAAATPPTATRWCGSWSAVGHEVRREFYVNDAGAQVQRFAALDRRPHEGRRGRPRTAMRAPTWPSWPQRLAAEGFDPADREALGGRGGRAGDGERAGHPRRASGSRFDTWFSERDLYAARRGRCRSRPARRRTATPTAAKAPSGCARTEFGDDKDRVLIRAGGEPTYLARRRRLPLGQAGARLRAADRRARRRPPRLRPPPARRDRGARRRPRWLRGADHAPGPHRRGRRAGADVEAKRRLRLAR